MNTKVKNDGVYYYHSDLVGTLEIRISRQGVKSLDFVKDAPSNTTSVSNTDNRAHDPIASKVIKQLEEYFTGSRKSFSVPLDLNGSPFQEKVWQKLIKIPYGRTLSYGEVAALVDAPRAARAVGTANKSNSIPIIIPCHRVIKSDGGLGGYDSGIDIKKRLLDHEAAFSLT